ncbi:MAG TPA: tRNA (guanine-N7)-methyltransferase [Polyangiaceae bacterium LLY-WYZ-15_(1-7)]|nr:tRNA (guanine-N7)-methyltransferase [Myxococcales bacterium]MAT28981.1 tRNA (guanine-N7)-methyltransferase [Sandaracinus sp.]HJK90851.1 tRNA (guanine-N7)-methyltransferase [Polyangiaceae bacterium LLY-WYZ-15_(1-7)]HJL05260.1 tRNA (guanine-N7)-methyltransferase [Polyangiaceae bacterium LLY-WYZ-15_(1-7)]HJL07446.1 tRNA (guanine-N7)-methyltransferase [Polyangiaceae bacterium LLY-WYZ-15_(1-7)]
MQERVRYDLMAPRPPEEGPIDLEAEVRGEGPIELDIGFGRGMSVFTRIEAAPDARVLGIEIKAKWATKVERRRARRELEGVTIWAADARSTLARSGPDGCVARVSVHFPDPWWKKRHTKRRVLQPAFLDTLARLMRPGGELFVQTDVPDRHDLYVRLAREHEAFEVLDDALADNPFGGVSNREKRAIEDGLPIHRLLARRR